MYSRLFGELANHIDGAPKVDNIYRPLITIGEGKFAK